jgi:hypothetical protein
MLLYGLALATGRMVLAMDVVDIDAAVLACLTDRMGVAGDYARDIVADANASAFDSEHHRGQNELIGVGHSYFGVDERVALIDNVFANIDSVRKRAAKATK